MIQPVDVAHDRVVRVARILLRRFRTLARLRLLPSVARLGTFLRASTSFRGAAKNSGPTRTSTLSTRRGAAGHSRGGAVKSRQQLTCNIHLFTESITLFSSPDNALGHYFCEDALELLRRLLNSPR